MAETISCANCGTQLPGEARFCASCGATIDAGGSPPDATAHLDVPQSDHLTGDSTGVDHPGQEQTSPDLDDPDATTQKRRGVRVGLLVAILAVIAIGIGGAIAVSGGIGGGGQVDFIAVFEPERDGYGDLHWVRPGQELTRDTIIAQDIQLSTRTVFYRVNNEARQVWVPPFTIELDTHPLFSYTSEDDPDEVVVAALVDGTIVDLFSEDDGNGILTYEYQNRGLLQTRHFTETNSCEVRQLSIERSQRIARSDSCQADTQGNHLIGDRNERDGEVLCEWVYISTREEEVELPTTDGPCYGTLTRHPSMIGLLDDERTEAIIFDTTGAEIATVEGDLLGFDSGGFDFLIVKDFESDEGTIWLVREDGVIESVDGDSALVSPSGRNIVILDRDRDRDGDELRLLWTGRDVWDPIEVLDIEVLEGRSPSQSWFGEQLIFSAGDEVWLVGPEDTTEIREFEELEVGVNHLEDSHAVVRTSNQDRTETQLARLSVDGEAIWLTDNWSGLGFDVDVDASGSSLAVSGREDPNDDLVLLLVDLDGVERPVEVDDTEYGFINIRFIGGELYYSVKVGDDLDDWEVRKVNLSDPTRPEVVYEDAYAIIPDPPR